MAEEAEQLARRFEGVKQAAFAREYDFPGGPSMLSQNIHGRRPITMEGALIYARAFGVPLAEISPRLAEEAAKITSAATGAQVDEQPLEGDEELALTERQREFLRALEFLSDSGQQQALHDVQMRVAEEVAKGLMEGRLNVTGFASDKQVGDAYGTPATRPKGSGQSPRMRSPLRPPSPPEAERKEGGS